MFNCVHHVRILVDDADAMVQYMAQTFAMTPVKVQVYESLGMKNAIYKVGETNLEFTEPRMPSPPWGNIWRGKSQVCTTSRLASTGSQRWPKGWRRKAIRCASQAARAAVPRLSDGHAGPGKLVRFSLPSGGKEVLGLRGRESYQGACGSSHKGRRLRLRSEWMPGAWPSPLQVRPTSPCRALSRLAVETCPCYARQSCVGRGVFGPLGVLQYASRVTRWAKWCNVAGHSPRRRARHVPAPSPWSLRPRHTVCRDQLEQAWAELSAAIDLYHAMAMTFWLPETESALAQVERAHGL